MQSAQETISIHTQTNGTQTNRTQTNSIHTQTNGTQTNSTQTNRLVFLEPGNIKGP